MCGIIGIIKAGNHLSEAQQMLAAQRHRGPDAEQIWHDNTVVFGHNRLSIIDLSEAAHQPMLSACGRYVLVFNGEIYNYIEIKKELKAYPFATQSDSEVLLAGYLAWGEAVLDKLNGMFAFAIYDQQEKTVFFARDRFGVKPLYYAQYQDGFYFASEIKALWAAGIPKEKNKTVWASYLVHASYGMPHETFWNHILQLPAGHCMTIQTAKPTEVAKPKQWYDFVARIQAIPAMTEDQLRTRYFELLHDAIALRFRADVPVGMNVSGGLDSSTLIALVTQYLKGDAPIDAYTFYNNDERYDELPWVEKLVQKHHFPLHPVLFEVEKIPSLIQKMCAIQDEPFGGFPTLAYSQLFEKARSMGRLVLLDGQGMDEAWAGYDYYHSNSQSVVQGVQSSPVRPEVLTDAFRALARVEAYPKPFASEMQNKQYRDLFFTKLPRALRFNDRNSMMHSTELREPFLDYRLVELAFAQPDERKYKDGKSKWMLRELATKHLGKDLALAPKRPLQTPQREWLSGELQPFVNQQMEKLAKEDFIKPEMLKQVWNDYLNGNQDNSFYIWQWINLAEIC